MCVLGKYVLYPPIAIEVPNLDKAAADVTNSYIFLNLQTDNLKGHFEL